MSNDNYTILNLDSDPVVLECENKAAIYKFFNEHKDSKGRNISVVIPDGVTEIEDLAFDGCTFLISITIPGGVTEIEDFAFCDCSSLTSITIPEGVIAIGEDAFYGCLSLESIIIPEGVDLIWDNAFFNCSSLTSVIIPDSVTEIKQGAFSDCSSLELVIIPDDPKFNQDNSGFFNKVDFRGESELPNHVKLIKKTEYYRYVGGKENFDSLSKVAKQILNKMIALSLDDALLDNNSPNKFTPEFKSNLIKNINILAIKNPKDFLSVINSDDRAVALFSDNYEKNQASFSSSNNSLKTIDGELKKLFYPKKIGGVKIYGFIFKFYYPEISELLLCSKSRPIALKSILEGGVQQELGSVDELKQKFQNLQSVFKIQGLSNQNKTNQNQSNKQCEPPLKKANFG